MESIELRNWYKYFNFKYFYEELPHNSSIRFHYIPQKKIAHLINPLDPTDPTIGFIRGNGILGKVDDIFVAEEIESYVKPFVLLHECVHVWAHTKWPMANSHGNEFFGKIEKIYRDWNIRTPIRLPDGSISVHPRIKDSYSYMQSNWEKLVGKNVISYGII